MSRRTIALAAIGYLVAVIYAWPFGVLGGLTLYVAVASLAFAANIRAAIRRSRLFFVHVAVAVAMVLFPIGQILFTSDAGGTGSDIVFLAAYAASGLAAAFLARERIRELNRTALLESSAFVAGFMGAALTAAVVINPSFVPNETLLGIAPLLLLGALSFLGRSATTPTLRLYVASIFIAAFVEGFEILSVWGDEVRLFLSTPALIPLIFVGNASSTETDAIRPGTVALRRRIAIPQLLVTGTFLIASPCVIALRSSDLGPGSKPAAAVSALFVALVLARFALLISERDDDYGREQELRRLGEHLVSSTSTGEMVGRSLRAAAEVIPNKDIWIALVNRRGEVDRALSLSDAPSPHESVLDQLVERTPTSELESEQPVEIPGVSYGQSGFASVFRFRNVELGAIVMTSATPLASVDRPYLQAVTSQLELALTAANLREERHQERANRKFRNLVQDSNDVVLLVAPISMETTLVSPTVTRLLGYVERDFVGKSPFFHINEDDAETASRYLSLRRETIEPVDVRFVHADGQYRWFAMSIRDMTADEELAGFVLSFSDIHARKMAEVQLTSSESRYRTLIEQSDDVFALISSDLRFTFVSPNCSRMIGYEAGDLIGTHITGIVTPESIANLQDLIRLDRSELDGRVAEAELQTLHGDSRWVSIKFHELDVADDEGVMIAVRDITERRELEESMRHAALHDPLTGLFNRASLQHELNRHLQQMRQIEQIGVVHVDVRDFKIVNESLGFETGDQLLIEIAGRLRSGLRNEDCLGRLGADSFVVLTTVQSQTELESFARRLSRVFEEPFALGGRQHSLTVSIGFTSTNDRRENPVSLLEEAALAVRQAKVGSAHIVGYESWLREAATERFELDADLIPGIAAGQFSVVYQPLFSLSTNQVKGVEALLRWQHPERGHISPAVFIPLAEKSGAITELGRWVLEAACRQLVAWHEELPDALGLGMSVNVSARQLEDSNEFDVFHEIIRASGVDPSALTLELTETTMLDGIDSIREQLDRFRALGIKIAVDDFGTGTAGLNHLRDVPFDVLKVDKTYVDTLGKTGDAHALLSGVIELAHAMGALVVAEGIETPQQANELRQMGCDVGQGFYLGRPMDRARIELWFERGRDGSVASQIQQLAVDFAGE